MPSISWGKLFPSQRAHIRQNASKRKSSNSNTLSENQPLQVKVHNNNNSGEHKRSDGLYFLDDAGVVYRVETTLYRIPPSDLTRVSPVFHDMFEMPSGSEVSEGRGDDRPIFLESITRIDWERLLKVISHKSYLDPPLQFDMDEWISIEEFNDPARKIHVAREYGIPSYSLLALIHLVIRVKPLSAQDSKYLGLECAFNIASIRERRRGSDTYVGGNEKEAYELVQKEIFSVFEDHEGFLT
ncbi:hypothetical protein BDP27DRAFT_1361693 [Rhodocollybia butyracea]|uniref:BTB domain-containing protein n=1 Tax=Rhodocollybia butyracea TaxID=206335 RepID=A0A9P5UA08_9AGAR|nr:hypothetical protein BDP27DRAFT_1361693 [Rhodocollybia butyracea]